MPSYFFNRLTVSAFAFLAVGFISPASFSQEAAGVPAPEDPVYQLKGNPQDELNRIQKESAALDLEKEDDIEETNQVISSDPRLNNKSGEFRRYFQKGIELSLGYSFFSPYATGSGGGSTNSVSFTPSGSPSLGARYSSIRNDGFGYDIGLHFDPAYGASSAQVNGVTTPTAIASSGTFMTIVPELNVTFEIEGAYVFGGVNYTAPLVTSGLSTMIGGVGGQAGIGFFIGNSLSNLDFGSNVLSLEMLFQAYQVSFNLGGNFGASQPISMGGGMVRLGLNFR